MAWESGQGKHQYRKEAAAALRSNDLRSAMLDAMDAAPKHRKVRKPDPYKGKGLRYKGEVVKLRPGKRAGK